MTQKTRILFSLLLMVCILAAPSLAIQSSEPILVRVNTFDPVTRVYNMSCILPPTAGPDRTWSIRPDVSAAAIEYHTTINWSLVNITEDVMYHISCGAMNTTGYIMTDFHIDRRTVLPTDKPYITVDQTEGRTLRARCNIPANVTQYSLNWVLNGHGGTQQLPQFNNQLEITYTVPNAQQWEITCNVWDIPRSQYSRGGLSIEFFNNGPAYLPTLDGCIPGDACPYVTSPTRPIAWIGAWPHNSTNTTQNVTIASSNPSGASVTIPEPNNQTFMIALNNPSSLPTTTVWRLNGITQSAAANQLSYTFRGNDSASGVYDVHVMVQSPQNTVSRMWALTVTDTPQGNGSTNQTCYTTLQHIPATCTGGTITSDTFNGGRAITCAQGGNSLSITAWSKPDNTFEMYRQSSSGIAPKICLGTTCIQNNGFAKSGPFPICVNSTPTTPSVCGNNIVEQGEQCDGSAPNGAVCLPTCVLRLCHVIDTLREGETKTHQVNSASYETTLVFVSDPNEGPAEAKFSINGLLSALIPEGGEQLMSSGVRVVVSDILVNSREGVATYCLNMSAVPPTGTTATLSHARWFPQGHNTILVCNATGFTPTSYDFRFGDGSQTLNYNQNNVWHTYLAAGTYAATCTARSATASANASLSVVLN